MKIVNEIQTYEVGGVENTKEKVNIHSHWNRDEFVIIEMGDNQFTVSADELRRAIDNAQNWR